MKHCLVFASLISPSKMILFEKKYQTFDTVFHHQMKHLEVRQKYSAARRIFNSLLGVSSGDETLHLMFDILHHNSLNTHKCVILEKIKHHCKEKAMRLFQERGRLLEKEVTVLEPSDARTKSFHSDVQFFLRDILANFIDSRFL